ncbi:hypothetical protein [Polymorphobacter sp.]|uniref:hypothetical protein n=1 Tax=Polymorphobacter sp. TaxID=1909290 RepID=UPI003F7149BE
MGARTSVSLAVVLLGLAASGCASGPRREVAELKPTGAERMCLQLQDIRNTRVVDDSTIDFITRNGDVYRNRLPNSCPQLGFQQAFSYSTSITQLCSVDIITVLIQGQPGMRGASCGLGPFTPIARDRKASDTPVPPAG